METADQRRRLCEIFLVGTVAASLAFTICLIILVFVYPEYTSSLVRDWVANVGRQVFGFGLACLYWIAYTDANGSRLWCWLPPFVLFKHLPRVTRRTLTIAIAIGCVALPTIVYVISLLLRLTS